MMLPHDFNPLCQGSIPWFFLMDSHGSNSPIPMTVREDYLTLSEEFDKLKDQPPVVIEKEDKRATFLEEPLHRVFLVNNNQYKCWSST